MFSAGYVLKRVQTPTYLTLLPYKTIKLCSLEWIKIAILLIEMTESMVLHEEGKRLPSDA